jgi:uncharacterized protein involved in exopolysaccharide biosynthesis
MKYSDLLEICLKVFGTDRPAEIARELDVTPQAINNWKVRDQVPYKYVKLLKNIFDEPKNAQVPEFLNVGPAPNVTTFQNSPINGFEELFDILDKIYKIIKRNKMLLLATPIIITLLISLKLKFFTDLKYQSSCKVLPLSSGSQSANFSNIASRYGLNIGGQSNNSNLASSEMIPAIIKSRYLKKRLLKTTFYISSDKDSMNLLSILLNKEVDLEKIVNPKEKEKILKSGFAILDKSMSVSRDKGVELLNISFISIDPQLAKDMVDKLLVVLQKVMKEFKLERIIEKRKFIKYRMTQIKQALAKIEENLREFREQNRRILDSPHLMLQQERFIRDLQVQNQLYITMKAEYELARIEEIEVGSFIQVLDSPTFPIRPINISIMKVSIISLISSSLIIIIILFFYDVYRESYHTKKILNTK